MQRKPFTPHQLQPALERTKGWRRGYFAAVIKASQSDDFYKTAEVYHVAPALLVLYLNTMVGFSSTTGKPVFPARRKVASKIGRSVRQTARCRQAALALGFEETVGRFYKDPDGLVRRTSNLSRMHVPTLFLPLPAVSKRASEPVRAPASVESVAADAALDAYLSDGGGEVRGVPAERSVPVPPAGEAQSVVDELVQRPVRGSRRTLPPTGREALRAARDALNRDRSPP